MNEAADVVMKEMMDNGKKKPKPKKYYHDASGPKGEKGVQGILPIPLEACVGNTGISCEINEIEVIDDEIIKPTLDTNGDKLVTQEEFDNYYENGAWKDLYKGTAYYHNPKFDWNKTERWVNDEDASKHWLGFLGGNHTALEKYRNKN